ncbi:S-layer homology domain-containing protein [Bacillus hominis]|uniref:S-layer homology domain-containing protein n=1 Tax=Bacillus hominis TaxID=2817478 RepID=UPI003D65CAB4
MKKNLLKVATSLTLIGGILLTANGTPAYAEKTKEIEDEMIIFRDVADDHWARTEIYDLAHHNIMVGYGNERFGVGDNVTREQAAAVLFRALKMPQGLEYLENPYNDINDNSTMFSYEIKALTTRRIFRGDDNGNFRPKDALTRAEVAQILAKAYEFKVKEKHTFTDIPENHWAKDSISALQSNKAIVGTGNGLFEPEKLVTREQYAKFLHNAILRFHSND